VEVRVEQGRATLLLHGMGRTANGEECVRTEIHFTSVHLDQVQQWEEDLQRLLTQQNERFHRPVLLFVNPFGGKGQAMQMLEEVVRPMLDVSKLPYEVIETERAGHALEVVRERDLSSYGIIASLSGDGLLHEIVQGLLNRPDWEVTRKMPIALLPAGSGNGMATSLKIKNLASAVFNLIKGATEQIDLISLRFQSGERVYCHLAVFWGFIADTDLESEGYRWLGAARFAVGALVRIVNLRTYHGSLRYLPVEKESECSGEEDGPKENGPPMKYVGHDPECLPPGWEELVSDYVLFSASSTDWIASDYCIAPGARHDDGQIHLIWVIREKITKPAMVQLLLNAATGNHLERDDVFYARVKAFAIIPSTVGQLDVDGEPHAMEPFTAEILPKFLPMIMAHPDSCIVEP